MNYTNDYILHDGFIDNMDTISVESFEFNTPPKNISILSTSYDSDSDIAILYNRFSLLSDSESERKSVRSIRSISDTRSVYSNKSAISELNNIIHNKIFERENYKAEITKKNTFLNKKEHQIEFNKLVLNKCEITFIDKLILAFI
jgi:hypothetical protein